MLGHARSRRPRSRSSRSIPSSASCSPTVLREVVGGCAAGVDHLVVVGHNPGLSELTARLSGDPAEEGLATADWRSYELESL